MRICPVCLTQLSDGVDVCLTHNLAPDPMVGRVLGGRFQVGRRRQRDERGAAYTGSEVGTGRRVVIEVSAGDLSTARTLATVRQKNLLVVHHAELDDAGALCIVREWQQGQPLSEMLQEALRFDLLSGGRVALQLGRALQAIHNAGLAHGALGGAVVILLTRGDRTDYVKLGGYRLTPGGAPAQDVRRLAGLIYQLLCGQPPVRPLVGAREYRPEMSSDAEAVLMQVLTAAPDSGDIPTPVNFGTALARALLEPTSAMRGEDLPSTPLPESPDDADREASFTSVTRTPAPGPGPAVGLPETLAPAAKPQEPADGD